MYSIKRAQIYFILFIALFIHLTILDYVRIAGAKPDLVLICVVFFGLFLGSSAGFESGVVVGIFADMFTLDFFGINALLYGMAGMTAGLISPKIFKESKKTEFVLMLLFTAAFMSMHFVIVFMLSPALALTFRDYFCGSIVPTSLYTSLVAIPIFVKLIDIYNFRELQGLL